MPGLPLSVQDDISEQFMYVSYCSEGCTVADTVAVYNIQNPNAPAFVTTMPINGLYILQQ
jgi:hypothetical protein